MNGIFLVILLSSHASGDSLALEFKTEAACRSAAVKLLAAKDVESVGCRTRGDVKAVSKPK